MKEITFIPLLSGGTTLLDFNDLAWACLHVWTSHEGKYAVRHYKTPEGKWRNGWMHRDIIEAEDCCEVDHVNGSKLDNRRHNLRSASPTENRRNRPRRADNTSGYKGVNYNKRDQKFQARISVNGKSKSLGYYKTAIEAHTAYVAYGSVEHGKFFNPG